MSLFLIIFPQSWIAAATEAFLTWGMLGVASIQAASHVSPAGGKRLLRDSLVVVALTLTVLILVAFLADACTQLLLTNGYLYMHTSSFGEYGETMDRSIEVI